MSLLCHQPDRCRPLVIKTCCSFSNRDVLSPARLAGNVLLITRNHQPSKEPRKAWVYNAGQRRVRLAPQVSYDGPGTASDGMRTSDNLDMYNSAPDRYDWKLVGKQGCISLTTRTKLKTPS